MHPSPQISNIIDGPSNQLKHRSSVSTIEKGRKINLTQYRGNAAVLQCLLDSINWKLLWCSFWLENVCSFLLIDCFFKKLQLGTNGGEPGRGSINPASLVKGQMIFTDLVQKWDSETDAKFGRNDAYPSLFPAVLPARKEHYSYTHEYFIINQYCASL